MTENVIKLHPGDERALSLVDAILELIYDRAHGMPVPTVLGCIRLVEHQIIEDQT